VKIISQSTIAYSSAYFHLAYLAATHTAPARGLLGGGVLTLLLGGVLALRFVRRNRTGKGPGQIAPVLQNNSLRFLTGGLVCLAAGTAIICLSFAAGKTRYDHPESLTRLRMYLLSSLIEGHLAEGEPIPEDLATLAAQWGVPKSEIQDAWSNELRLIRTMKEEGTRYGLVGAGKDKEFGTGDDLILAIPDPQDEPEATARNR